MKPTDDLTPDSPDDLFEGFAIDVAPPAELRTEVLARLRDEGLLTRPPRPGPAVRWSLTAAALVGVFLAGRASAPAAEPGPAAPVARATEAAGGVGEREWALLLYEDARFDTGSLGPDDIVKAYTAWAEQARDAGRLVMGEKLGEQEAVVAAEGVAPRAEGADARAGVLTGFFIVRASDEGAAMDIARGTPHHRFGGTVLVRPIDPT